MEVNKENVAVLSFDEYERLKGIEKSFKAELDKKEEEYNDKFANEVNELINKGKVKVINLKTTTNSIIDQSFVASSSDAVIQRVLEMMGITNIWIGDEGTVLSLRVNKIRWFKSDFMSERYNQTLQNQYDSLVSKNRELENKVYELRTILRNETPELEETPEETETSKPTNVISRLLNKLSM